MGFMKKGSLISLAAGASYVALSPFKIILLTIYPFESYLHKVSEHCTSGAVTGSLTALRMVSRALLVSPSRRFLLN